MSVIWFIFKGKAKTEEHVKEKTETMKITLPEITSIMFSY